MDGKFSPLGRIWSTYVTQPRETHRRKNLDALVQSADEALRRAEHAETKFTNWARNNPEELAVFEETGGAEAERSHIRSLHQKAREKLQASQGRPTHVSTYQTGASRGITNHRSWRTYLLETVQL